MSRAIPSSYSEYLYTDQSDIIVDGGIMPLRNSSDPTSTWYRKCIRGEDPIFLREAMNLRRTTIGATISRQPYKQLSSSYTAEYKDNIRIMWDSGRFSSTAPAIQVGVLSDDQLWGDYIRPYFTLPTRQSANDTYTVLAEAPIMNLFKDVKQLNYSYTLGSRGSCCPYGELEHYTYTYHEIDNRPGHTPSPDYDQSGTSWLWYEHENISWYQGRGYPSDIEYKVTYTMKDYSLTFDERTSNPPNLWKTCVEIQPWAEMEVSNYGTTSDYHSYIDQLYDVKMVMVPLKSGFTDMLNETVPSVSQTELSAAIDLAYQTAGMQRRPSDIPLTPATGTNTYRTATSTCRIWTLFYVVHFKYCSLENITIT